MATLRRILAAEHQGLCLMWDPPPSRVCSDRGQREDRSRADTQAKCFAPDRRLGRLGQHRGLSQRRRRALGWLAARLDGGLARRGIVGSGLGGRADASEDAEHDRRRSDRLRHGHGLASNTQPQQRSSKGVE